MDFAITTDLQYAVAKDECEKFARAIHSFGPDPDPVCQAELDGLRSVYDTLNLALAAYEAERKKL